MNIGSLLPRHARYRSKHLAFVIGEERLNFCELNIRVNKLANALLAAGILKGQKNGDGSAKLRRIDAALLGCSQNRNSDCTRQSFTSSFRINDTAS